MQYRILFSGAVALSLSLGLSACVLPMQPIPGPVTNPTFPLPEVTILPSMTASQPAISIPIEPTIQPSSTVISPTLTTSPILTQTITPSPHPTSEAIATPDSNIYAVVLVSPDNYLKVYTQPSSSSSVVATLPYNESGIARVSSDSQWVQVNLAGSQSGWAERTYLTEYVSAASFKNDPQVKTLIDQFTTALTNKDGNLLASLVSPVHGLRLQYLRGGTTITYESEIVKWLFDSTYVVNWGLHPGSGLPIKGSFAQEVLPALLDTFQDPSTQVTYENLQAGGTTYTATWSKEYTNINFISAYKPGPAGHEMNWRTWLVGIEYVDSKPYLFALNMLVWEP